jgi:hypothetical protein
MNLTASANKKTYQLLLRDEISPFGSENFMVSNNKLIHVSEEPLEMSIDAIKYLPSTE